MSLSVSPVRGRIELGQFVHLPYRHYAGEPNWVPPLLLDQKELLNRRRHPFYRQAEAEFFLARRDGNLVGRIAAIHNRAHNEFHEDRIGFFGFFESEPHLETARALLEAAANWCAARNLTSLRGPANPSTNYECGLLVDGFDQPNVFMMPYNPPYYCRLLEGTGFTPAKDLLAYWLTDEKGFPEKLATITDRVLQGSGLSIRTVRLDRMKEELDRIFQVYNNAWSRNWGFVPMSKEELATMAAGLKWVLDPRVCYLLERGTEPVGFMFAIPDLNRILIRMKGRLLPFGWWRLLRERRRQSVLRVIAMGLSREYQNLGFTAALYREITTSGVAAGYHQAEISWVMMNRAAGMLGATLYKRYRIYEKPL
jgi:hypothetical protein